MVNVLETEPIKNTVSPFASCSVPLPSFPAANTRLPWPSANPMTMQVGAFVVGKSSRRNALIPSASAALKLFCSAFRCCAININAAHRMKRAQDMDLIVSQFISVRR